MNIRTQLYALLPLALCALIAGPIAAQLNWGVISTAGDPDPVTVFDLANPNGSQQGLGFVDGNFNRGMDFDSPDTFYYYVSTDTLNEPGDRGLWRYDNGTNTQLATVDFSDSTGGDATLSNDLSRFYVAVDDQDSVSGDSIYVFDNLNGAPTFTEIGETGLTGLIGIAVDPVSGDLYGYDSVSESLYTIDLGNATPTLVGASNQSLSAIGGMDFSQDGATLLLTGGSDLYSVNPADGALTFITDLGLNTSTISYRVVPEPTAGILLLFGLMGMLGLRR